MFRRYPYWGWLSLSLLLWCISAYNFHVHRQAMLPERMARAVSNDLEKSTHAWHELQKDNELIRRMFADSLTDKEANRVFNLPFFLYGYENDTLQFWNTNKVVGSDNDSALDRIIIVRNEKGTFLATSTKVPYIDNHKRLVALFPVLITYPLENAYLRSHFAASDYIPVKTQILPPGRYYAGAHAITLHGNNVVFFLRFDAHDIQKWTPDILFLIVLLAALIASISWIQLMTIYLTRNRSSVTGLIATLSVILVLRVLLYAFGLPFHLDTLQFFDPGLYATNKYLSSFGDLFIDTLCILWIVIFIVRHTPYKTYFLRVQRPWLRYLFATVIMLLLIGYVYMFVAVIRSLVLDSSISFEVAHFNAINIYSILGLLVICTIAGISCLIIYICNVQFNILLNNIWIKYFLMAALCGLILAVTWHTQGATDAGYARVLHWFLPLWLLAFIVFLDIPGFTLVSDLFEPHMIFWAIFICVFCTVILHYFNEAKENERRIAYVRLQLSPHRDEVIEYAFDKTAKKIEQDKALREFFYNPTTNTRKLIDQHFGSQYLTGLINRYDARIYLFSKEMLPLFNKDTISYAALFNEKNEAITTKTSNLFYKESVLERHHYLSYIPIYSDTINEIIGHVVINMELKKQVTQAVYPELLQPLTSGTGTDNSEYAYAVYINDRLVSQTNDNYPFTTHLKNDTLRKEQDYDFYNNNGISELYYKVADNRTIVVVHNHNIAIETLTLFCYVFGMLVLLAIFILFYQLYLSYFTGTLATRKFARLTLQKRVRFSMLAIVLISFVIIGTVTIWFFNQQYQLSNASKLRSGMQAVKQPVQDYFTRESALGSEYRFDTVGRSAAFKDFLATLARAQKTDINIFDQGGELINTSQDDIYNKGLISRMIRPDAFYQLNVRGNSVVTQTEKVANLSYLSAYEPIRDERGVTMGYLNIPFFASEKDLNFQISSIVVSLINLYAFIFLLSSVITVFITRWITNTFSIIIRQFGKLNLQRNERVAWPYDDEIGLLVREYNKMVNKVEENAAIMAQNERETAWREMARQVAHEIKNPLTPMKLNIQYLRQAMKNDAPNIKELTDRVSESIIEQIDNLSYIANEFSNFAKMPEARPEVLELNEMLHKALELYMNDGHVRVTIGDSPGKLFVNSDRSQVLRVFTNLLENAKQSIPEERPGNIVVSMTTGDGNALISIADNGTGISEEVSKRIFQPYFTTKSSGTGLGLAMTKKIIEFWKGDIWFDTVEGEGTTFHIRLPLQAGRKEGA